MAGVGERQVAGGKGTNPSGSEGWRYSGPMAEAMLYRHVYNAYKIKMKGESMRKWYAKKDDPAMMGE